ncbi:MAG: polyprenyl synthetase family protein [Lachnoclostridium sp.]|nr:polyprenyl synthetase family protein [Lachnoclostridium sp.]
MAKLTQIRQSLSSELDMLNTRIADALDSSNEMMNSIIANYLGVKGKQLRPILVILTAELFGKIDERIISAAAAVELLHNASLIHDDVVDDSSTRHGRPTINTVWDNHIAVLVGDFFVSTSLTEAVTTGDLRVIKAISELGRNLSVGEMDQIYNARFHSLDEDSYFKIISHKTASLFVSCVRMGCYLVNANDEQLHKMEQFAELFGRCFQIRDDILDYFDDASIGKPTGNDLREGKITLPLLYALSLTDKPQSAEMIALSRKEVLSTDEINTLIKYAKECGGIEYARHKIEELAAKARDIIRSFTPCKASEALISLIDSI